MDQWHTIDLHNIKHIPQLLWVYITTSPPYTMAAYDSRQRTELCQMFSPLFEHSKLLKASYNQPVCVS